MAKTSFSDAILEEPDRFVNYAFAVDPKIKDFSDFDEAFRLAFDTPNGQNANISSEDIIKLFESTYCKSKIKDNVSSKEYDRLYGDGMIVERTPANKNQVVTITGEKVSVKSHKWKGKEIKPYSKIKSRPYSNAEIKYIQARKQKGVKASKIIKDYETHFSKNPRTKSSIRSKIYRI